MCNSLKLTRLFRYQLFVLAAVLLLASRCLLAATFYVSPSGNDTTGNGSLSNPWRTITKGQSILQPGDKLLVRGGRYRETVTLTKQGTSGNPITIKAYPGEIPILDGTEPVTGWTQCASDEAGLTVQGVTNPDYASIYKATIHEGDLPTDISKFLLFENGVHCRVARDPNAVYGYGQDYTLYTSLEAESYTQTAYLVDSDVLTQADDYWVGAFVDVYSRGANGWVIRRTIADSSQSGTSITFNTALSDAIIVGDSYSIVNHPHILNSPGEFCYSTTPDGEGYYTFYLWLLDTDDLTAGITIPSKTTGITLTNRDYVTIDGIKVIGYVDDGITSSGGNETVVISNCIVWDCGPATAANGIYINGQSNNVTIEDCEVRRCGGRGVFINGASPSGATNAVIQRCEVWDTGSTNISFYYVTDGRIIHNTPHGMVGAHGNGISVYNNCIRNLVAFNNCTGTNIAFNSTEDLIVFGNIANWYEETYYVCAKWANTTSKGYHVYAHNTFTEDSSNSALALPVRYSSQEVGDVPHNYIFNNVIDGVTNWEPAADSTIEDRTYNYYTGYNWRMIGWDLKEGEVDGRNCTLRQLFANPGKEGKDYSLKEDSPLIGKGKSLSIYLNDPESPFRDFPDFDFTKDIAGNSWASTPSIGAYEYSSVSPVNQIPQATADSFTVQQDSSDNRLSVLANDSDPDGDVLMITTVKTPGQGTATISSNNLEISYTPRSAYSGPDSFEYTVSDGSGGTSTATVVVRVEQADEPVQTPATDLKAGLVAEYRFNENGGNTIVDHSGNDNTATLMNQAQWANGALSLDGTTEYVECTNNSSLNLTTSLTLSAWIMPRSHGQGGYGRIIDKGTSGSGFTFFVSQGNNNVGYAVYGGPLAFSDSQVLRLNKRQHVAVTYDDSVHEVCFYVNGLPSGQAAYSTSPYDSGSSPMALGIRRYDMQRAFEGLLDNVRVYNRALSTNEVAGLYELGTMAGRWGRGDYSTLKANDSTGNNDTASLVNMDVDPSPWRPAYDSIDLDGNDDHINCGSGTSLNLTGDLTLMALIYPETFGGSGLGRIVDKQGTLSGYAFYLNQSTGGLSYRPNAGTEVNSDGGVVNVNQWQHVALSYSDNTDTLTFYINGDPAGIVTNYQTNPNDSTGVPLIIGNNAAMNCGFKGMISDVRLFSRALTADEISAVHRAYEVRENKLIAFDISANDSNGNPLTWAVQNPQNLPTGAAFSNNVFTWRPWYNQAGDYDVTFEVPGQPDYTYTVPMAVENQSLKSWFRRWLENDQLNKY